MNLLRCLPLAVAALLAVCGPALAQTAQTTAQVVSACGAPIGTYAVGSIKPQTQDTTGKQCSGATFSGSVTANTTATASATPTAISAGTGQALNENLFSSLFVQPTFAGTPVDLTHGLPTDCVTGCSGGPADESAITFGTTPIFTGGVYQTTATSNALTTGQMGIVQMTANRAFFVNLRNSSGAELGVASAPVQVSLANTAANGTAVLVTGTGGSFPIPANSSVNVAQVGGSAIALGSAVSASSIPVVIASDQGAVATKLNATPTLANGNGIVQTQGGAVLSATNGVYSNLLQGNAVLAASNPIFVTGSGTAGTAATNPITVQGIASMTPVLVNPGTAANFAVGATGSAPPANGIYNAVSSAGNLTGVVGCGSHTYVHVTTATNTLLVQGVSAQTVKMCGVKVNFAGSAAQSVYIENTASTNANCSSTKTQIGPLITGSATVPSSDGFYNPIWGGFANTSANGVCVNSSGTGPVDVEVWYTSGS